MKLEESGENPPFSKIPVHLLNSDVKRLRMSFGSSIGPLFCVSLLLFLLFFCPLLLYLCSFQLLLLFLLLSHPEALAWCQCFLMLFQIFFLRSVPGVCLLSSRGVNSAPELSSRGNAVFPRITSCVSPSTM